jgi:hypothetical protein
LWEDLKNAYVCMPREENLISLETFEEEDFGLEYEVEKESYIT